MSVLARLLPERPLTANFRLRRDRRRRRDDGEQTGHRWSMRAWRCFKGLVVDYRWYIMAVAALVAFILGCIGWAKSLDKPLQPSDASYIAYWSFSDFLGNSPDNRHLPWELDVARFLAPVVAGWAGVSALGLLFRDRVQQMRIPLMRRHVVMCGVGRYVGIVFLRQLRDKRIPVVVIEVDGANPNIELCRSLGVPVIVGDAQRLRTLQAAGAQRASRLLVVSPDDAVNTQIVATWQLVGRRSREAGCMARISDPELSLLLWIQELQRGDPELSVDYFNIDEISARLLLEEFPVDADHGPPHIVVAHLDPLGMWLVYHAARSWFDSRGDSAKKMMVTVLDEDPQERVDALLGQHPALDEVCRFVTDFSLSAKDIGRLSVHHLDPANPPIRRAYVTAYEDEQAFETALKLRHDLDQSITVVVALSRSQGVAGLLDDVKQVKEAGALTNIKVFPTMERTCTAELVQGGSFEMMARAIHEHWRRTQVEACRPATTWEDLDESRRQSSRHQARGIPVKLRMVGCAITPLRNWDARDFKFTDEEVETLAVEEHDRWSRERIWTASRFSNPEGCQDFSR